MESDKNTSFVDIFMESVKPLGNSSYGLYETVKAVSLVTSLFFLVSSIILNFAVIINILCTRKTSVAYFRLMIVYSIFHILFQASDCYLDCQEIFNQWLDSSQALIWLETNIGVLRRGLVGILFLLVSTLTIERFLASVMSGAASICLQFLTALLALSGPAILVAFQIISTQRPSSTFSLDYEVWFGLEVGIYIILPLLILTIFGTVNYCKVSISSRKMPNFEVSAVKTNIGLVVLTNISIFIFLIQECLLLWLVQLNARTEWDQAVLEMSSLVSVSQLCVRLGFNVIQFVVPMFLLCLSSTCCSSCCCSSIDQLREARYQPVNRTADNVSL